MSNFIEEKYLCPRCLRTYTVKTYLDLTVEMSGAPDKTFYYRKDLVYFVCGCKKGGIDCFRCDTEMLIYIS